MCAHQQIAFPGQVFDNSCHAVHKVTAKNPCKVGVFDCGSAQSTPTALHLDGHKYACKADTNTDSCNGHPIQVCVSRIRSLSFAASCNKSLV
ncbi:hypothetical protein PISMIDRAFT_466494 [Pisolithus microcarpus 441]|uniref:Uncharacterized protein n=1 Tax=Pisolithus microcarpus 441 TaxID=765257 RepID=A0A0C9ZBE8_9AGAM|nr:hypothetical protein BKA83DRAFT_466494 [Pisolithus microcarpus]KIK23274.1 hypothetical protein PISMIDRAFT_466494 [Pisolithus microcarpus 441]